MKQSIIFCSPLLTILATASLASATTYYAKPGGTGTTCGATSECSLGTAAGKAGAGDTVILRDGNYGETSLSPPNSGNSSAWITFQADAGATPIIDGAGVGSSTSQYLRFVGIVSRYNQYGGFGNGYSSACAQAQNGNMQYIDCIADGNGINGIAHYCAGGLLIQQSILAHNGNGTSSWSSAVNLYGVTGGTSSNIVRETVSFDTIDTSSTHSSSGKATDGSGFILDEYSQGATFVNNIGFENGGSCIRLTNSSNSLLVNNTCYGNGKDPLALYNDEILYSDAASRTGASLINNVIVVTTTGKNAIGAATGVTQTNNVTNVPASYFVSVPGAANIDFNLTSAATTLIDKGTTSNAPTNDIGFDPKCIKQGTLSGSNLPSWLTSPPSWWTYVIDYAYIQQIGGVAKCFNPRTRTAVPDVGAFEYNGTAAGGSPGTGGAPSTGGMANGTGGTPGTGGVANATGGKVATGGMTGVTTTGGSAVVAVTGGANANGGSPLTGGTPNTGGLMNANTGGMGLATGGAVAMGGNSSVAGAPATGGSLGSAGDSSTDTAGAANTGGAGSSTDAGSCSCRIAGLRSNSTSLAGLGLLGLSIMRTLRRRRS